MVFPTPASNYSHGMSNMTGVVLLSIATSPTLLGIVSVMIIMLQAIVCVTAVDQFVTGSELCACVCVVYMYQLLITTRSACFFYFRN